MYTFDYTNIVMTADGGYVALHQLTKEKVIKFQFLQIIKASDFMIR